MSAAVSLQKNGMIGILPHKKIMSVSQTQTQVREAEEAKIALSFKELWSLDSKSGHKEGCYHKITCFQTHQI
jgi:hypothetical protein